MAFTGASVEDRVVVITGGGTGIGAAIAERFASEGARVTVVGRRAEPLAEVAGRIGATPVVADAGDAGQMRAAIAGIVEREGGIDVLVANAGGHGLSTVGDTDDSEWALALQSNVTSAFVAAREALPALVAARGQIVVVASLAGLFAGPGVAGYTVGKHALIGLTRSLARDYGRWGVRVNAICPGWVVTPMADAEMDALGGKVGLSDREQTYRLVTEDVPLGRPAEPSEIAAVARFLGSAESSYITGATIVADGGAHVVDLPTLAFANAGL